MHTSHRERFPNDLTKQVSRDGLHPVASGGFADIYRGWLQLNGKLNKVAIKAIKCYTEQGGSFSKKHKRLRREIKVWLDLKHDNVLPLLGTTMGFGQFPAMVCPWAENGSLTSYLEQCYDSLSVPEILSLLSNVASGLQYLHSRSVVHGDLSGSNVLIGDEGRACIADFGLSMLLTELGGSTFATSFHARGTLRWTAPELLDLEIREEDEESEHMGPTVESDVYSFGSIMLQVLSGRVPYHYYRREAQVLHAVSKGRRPERPNNTMVTDDRWTFIEQCWAGRFNSQGDVRPSSKEIVAFIEEELATDEESNGAPFHARFQLNLSAQQELTRPELVSSINSSETSLDALSLLLPPRVADRVRIPIYVHPSSPLDSSERESVYSMQISDSSNPNLPIATTSMLRPSTSHVPTRQIDDDEWSALEESEHVNRSGIPKSVLAPTPYQGDAMGRERERVPVGPGLPPLHDVQSGVSSWYRPKHPGDSRSFLPAASRSRPDYAFPLEEMLRVGYTVPEDTTVLHPLPQHSDWYSSKKSEKGRDREGSRDRDRDRAGYLLRGKNSIVIQPPMPLLQQVAPISEKRTGMLGRLRRLLGMDDQV